MNVMQIRLVSGKPRCQRGFSLWEMAVLLGLLGIAIVAGFALLKSDRAAQIESGRTAQLSAADRALAGYIAENGRLPCPATIVGGAEDCSASGTWLPVVTLGLSASAPARGVAQLKYIVYRDSGDAKKDLAVASDRYNPVKYDLTTTYTYNQLNTLDFCRGLTLADDATKTTPIDTSARIRVPDASGTLFSVNVAYALAESGIDRDENGKLFDGPLNTSTTDPVLESPARAADTDYDDIVLARSFADLRNAIKCPQATRSVDAISMAVEMNITVADLKAANLSNGIQQSVNAGIATAMGIAAMALTVGSIVAGGVIYAEAVAALAISTGLCVVAVGCPKVATDTQAVAWATAGLVLAAASVVAYEVAVPLNIAALIASIIATAKAGAAPPASRSTPAEILAELKKAAEEAATKAGEAEAAAVTARAAAVAAQATYNTNVNNLYQVGHFFNSSASNDPKLATALAAYVSYAQAAQTWSSANGDAQARRTAADKVAAAIPTAIAERDAAVADALANPTDAKKQTLATNKKAVVVSLQKRATDLAAAATLAEADAAGKLTAMNAAKASYDTAKAAAVAAYSIAPPNEWSRFFVSYYLDVAVNSYYAPYSTDNYVSRNLAAINLESAAIVARQNANSMQAAYISLLKAPSSGATTGGPAAKAYSGAEAILKQADFKGALQ